MENEVVIKVDNVSKVFKLPHEKNTSLKSAAVNFYRKNKSFEMQEALNNVSFEVNKGEFFGIVGRNGSGKSTLLKLLAGIYTPTTGTIDVRGKLTPFIELGVGFNPELTGRENVYLNGALLGFNRKEMRGMYKEIVEFAEIGKFMQQKLKNYSSGMQVRLAFSIAIRAQSDILLIDEVLAVGDLLFQQKCYDTFKKIKREGRTVVFVSHDLGAIESFCDRVMILNRGEQISIRDAGTAITDYKSLVEVEEIKNLTKKLGKGDHIVSDDRITITDAQILVDKKVTSEIAEKKPFTVRLHYHAKQVIEKPTFGIGIMNYRGDSIIGPNTREAGYIINRIEGRGFIEASFDLNILSPGLYKIRAGVFDETGVIPSDFVENLVKFRVSGQVRHGEIYVSPTWKLEPNHKDKVG